MTADEDNAKYQSFIKDADEENDRSIGVLGRTA